MGLRVGRGTGSTWARLGLRRRLPVISKAAGRGWLPLNMRGDRVALLVTHRHSPIRQSLLLHPLPLLLRLPLLADPLLRLKKLALAQQLRPPAQEQQQAGGMQVVGELLVARSPGVERGGSMVGR